MEEIVTNFLRNGDPVSHQRAVDYFDRLKQSPDGWKQCVQAILANQNMQSACKFFCLGVIETYLKIRYAVDGEQEQNIMRAFVTQWITRAGLVKDEIFVANKFAQIVTQVVLIDYPTRWASFFNDCMAITSQPAWDLYLRILTAINQEIAEREIPRTQKEAVRGTLIKDKMRETCVPQLVDSWYNILTTPGAPSSVYAQCLQTIGFYVSWIDLSLICNDRFMSLFLSCLDRHEEDIKEAVAECFTEIVQKGMEPGPKILLVTSILELLQRTLSREVRNEKQNELDYVIKLSKLLNFMTNNIIVACQKITPKKESVLGPEQRSMLQTAEELMETRLFPLVDAYFRHEFDDVSGGVTDCIREYLQYVKQRPYGDSQRAIVQRILMGIVEKYKFVDDYDFESQGEDEADFVEYRRSLKVLFDNISQLDKELVLCYVQELVRCTLSTWKTLKFQDVEAAIAFLYLLGEAVPQQNEVVTQMISNLIASEVYNHPHQSVRLQFFETCARFDKLFTAEMLPPVIAAFLDGRGLRATSPNVRSRCSYLFSRMIKSSRYKLEAYAEEILCRLHELLLLPQFNHVGDPSRLSNDDQLYLYEATAVLVISSQFSAEKKESLLRQLLSPVMQSYTVYTSQLNLQIGAFRVQMAELMCHAIALTSRTSKAFSNSQTMRACNCVKIYTDAISIFEKALNLAVCDDPAIVLIHSALRQFLHRMVVCLDSGDLMPFVPRTLATLLGIHVPIPPNCNLPDRTRPLQETIPLINQILAKYKRDCVPMMTELFLPTVDMIFKCLNVPVEPSDQVSLKDRQMLQRSYFNLIFAMTTTDILTEVISPQKSQNLEQVFNTIIQGAVDFPDPVSQKTCFSILRKMIDTWCSKQQDTAFIQFVYNAVLPACFQAPLKDTFDLEDAQTTLVLSESANCMQSAYKARGEELLIFLTNDLLPKLSLDDSQILDYRSNLTQDIKIFKVYIKKLFEELRTRAGL